MLAQVKTAKHFCKFNKYPGSDEPANYRNKLPEHPMLWPFGQFLHHPCVVKRNICFPGGTPAFSKSFAKPKEGRKTSNVPIR